MAADEMSESTASQTIDLLETRLRRIEYMLRNDIAGDAVVVSTPDTSATQRLAALERSLHQLAAKSRVVQELLKLYAKHPDLFHPTTASDLPTTLDIPALLSIVLSSASSYHSTASRLTSILDTPIPPSKSSSHLIDLRPRIAEAEAIQRAQSEEIAALKVRSAAVIQMWYEGNVLEVGDAWAEAEARLGLVEQRLRRTESAKRANDV